ncbi:MAG TPA: Asp23/Gls24 family envelope stress response protein [Streptosporangiaceae bacterium]|nr:Asp23/Gls24 family envelope stress response protein [Streptosporangiaceae bacterium]
MTDLEDTRAANGGGADSGGTEVASAPFFPASPPEAPAAASPPAAAVVKGRITIEDEVAEKVAALAALEVDGVADLGGDVERALESVRGRIGVGQRRGDQGVRAKVNDREVAIDVTIVVEYGRVAMDVATAVKANVARQANHMLGMRVTEVNVTVDDVSLPGERRPRRSAADMDTESDAESPAAGAAGHTGG